MVRKLLVAALMGAAAKASIVTDVRSAIAAGDFNSAKRETDAYHKTRGNTPELALAISWLGGGYLDANQLDNAEATATEARKISLAEAEKRKLDAEPLLPEALGASIEVHAQALERRGSRSEAVSFLRVEAAKWTGTSIQARIRKNLNLLTLEGRPAPPIDVSHWTGTVKPQSLGALRGHPVSLFFWAHWCGDCKAEAPVIQDVVARYGPAGLKVIAPTMHYGYAEGGEDASPDQETAWIEATRKRYYARIGPMPVPVSESTLRSYGVSTTPTLVLIDASGVVRLYHPGAMSLGDLAPLIAKLTSPGASSRIPHRQT